MKSSANNSSSPKPVGSLIWCWFIIWLLALIVHGEACFRAGSFWLDETDSIEMASRSIPDMWRSLAYDTFPIAHVLIFKIWLGLFSFLPTETAIRGLSFLVAAGIASVFLQFGRRYASTAPPLIFALFMLNPVVARYMDSARPYGLSTLFFALLAYNALVALETGSRRRVAASILFAFLAVHTHYFNAVGVLAVALVVALQGTRSKLLSSSAARAIAFGLGFCLVSLVIYYPSLKQAATWMPLSSQGTKNQFFAINWMLNDQSISPAFLWIFVLSLSLLLVLGKRLAAAKNSRVDARESALSVGITGGILAPVLLLTAMHLGHTNVAPWYYIPTLGLMALCLGPAWNSLGRLLPKGNLVLGTVTLVLAGLQLTDGQSSLSQPMAGMAEAANLVSSQAKARDLILVAPWPSGVTFNHYYRGDAPFSTLPPLVDYSIVRYDLLGEALAAKAPLAGVQSQIDSTLKNGGHIFLIGTLNPAPIVPLDRSLPPGRQLTNARALWEGQIRALLKSYGLTQRELRPEGACFSGECPSVGVFMTKDAT